MKVFWRVGCAVLVVFVAAAVMFPLISSARFASDRNYTMSGVRQITTGLAFYLADFDDTHPPDVMRTFNRDTKSAVRHKQLIYPYMKNDDVWTESERGKPFDNSPRIGMDGKLSAYCTVGDLWLTYKLPNSNQVRAKLGEVADPAALGLYRENLWPNPENRGALRSGKTSGLNMTFVDTHGAFVPIAAFVAKAKVL